MASQGQRWDWSDRNCRVIGLGNRKDLPLLDAPEEGVRMRMFQIRGRVWMCEGDVEGIDGCLPRASLLSLSTSVTGIYLPPRDAVPKFRCS